MNQKVEDAIEYECIEELGPRARRVARGGRGARECRARIQWLAVCGTADSPATVNGAARPPALRALSRIATTKPPDLQPIEQWPPFCNSPGDRFTRSNTSFYAHCRRFVKTGQRPLSVVGARVHADSQPAVPLSAAGTGSRSQRH